MMHCTCDHCGKELRLDEEKRYVVKIEITLAEPVGGLTEEDLDEDHLEAVSQILKEAEEDGDLEEPRRTFRYDLCHDCQRRFVRDPLAKEQAHKLFFSKN